MTYPYYGLTPQKGEQAGSRYIYIYTWPLHVDCEIDDNMVPIIASPKASKLTPFQILSRSAFSYKIYAITSIFQGVLFGSKGWCMGTPYHPFSTLWKIQEYNCWWKKSCTTFYLLNPMKMGYSPYQLVQGSFHQPYNSSFCYSDFWFFKKKTLQLFTACIKN